MRLAIGADHAGFALKAQIIAHLRGLGHDVTDHGTLVAERCDYPDLAVAVAQAVASREAELGFLCCGTGQGMAMTANRVPGVRAAACSDTFSARATRQHNDANVLCLGERVLGVGLALELVDAFLSASFEGGRHAERVQKITALEPLGRSA